MPRLAGKNSFMILVSILISITVIVSYIYITYISIDKSFYSDKVTWYHIHILKYISSGGDLTSDNYLWFPVGKDLTRSPILLDLINVKIGNNNPGLLTLVMGVLLGIEAFFLAYIIFKDKLTASLSLALTLLVPATAYWFKYTNYGAYVAIPLGVLTLILLSLLPKYSGGKTFWKILAIGIISYILSWAMWSAAWIIPLTLSLYMIVLMYAGGIDKKMVITSAILFTVSIILSIIVNYFTIYHLFSLALLGTTTLFSYIEYTFISTITLVFKRNIWRFVSAIFSICTAVIVAYIIASFFKPQGFIEPYSKQYNPIADIFPVVVLAPFSLVIYMRSRLLTDLKKNSTAVTSIIVFIVCIIVAYVEPPLAVLATLAISPFIMFSLSRVAYFIYREYSGKPRVLALAAITWILIGLIAGSAVGAHTIALTPSQIYYSGISPAGHGYKTINESGLAILLKLVDKNSVVIAHWDKALWITGLKPVYVLADDHGPEINRRIISLIMISDEETARALIEKYINTSKYKVYILITEIVSVDKTPLGIVRRAVHIGRAFTAGETSYGTQEMIYIPFGDAAKLLEYVRTAGKHVVDYINLKAPIRSSLQLPLAWSSKAEESLLVRLIADSIFNLGYNPVNDLVSSSPLTRVDFPKLKYFKFINATMTYLDTLHTNTGDYEIKVLVALYEFVPTQETS